MERPVVQIQVRLGSTRLPGKVLYPLAGERIIRRVVDRAKDATEPEKVALTIGDRPENDAIIEWCKRSKIQFHTGAENDLLARHLNASREFGSDPIVRITGDCPFVPAGEIDRVLHEHMNNNFGYTTNVTDEMPIGTAVDVIDRSLLLELQELGDTHPVRRLRDHPDSWGTKFSPADKWTEYADAHTAVDTPKDYWTLTDAIAAVGDNPRDVTEWIASED